MKKERNPIDAILDENDIDPIILYDDKNNPVEFEQICLVPIKDIIYTILRPTAPLEGLGEDEALVFQIIEDEMEDSLIIITDDKIIDEVFAVYNKLLDEAKDEPENKPEDKE